MARNILLILTDQHRYDIVGANGSEICRSPNLDALAASGERFTAAYSVCPLCTPARASIYTGVAPHRHGLLRNIMENTPNGGSIPEALPTLAQRLGEAGYTCHFRGKWHAGNRPASSCGFEGLDVAGYGNVSENPAYHDYLQARGLQRPVRTPLGGGWAHSETRRPPPARKARTRPAGVPQHTSSMTKQMTIHQQSQKALVARNEVMYARKDPKEVKARQPQVRSSRKAERQGGESTLRGGARAEVKRSEASPRTLTHGRAQGSRATGRNRGGRDADPPPALHRRRAKSGGRDADPPPCIGGG